MVIEPFPSVLFAHAQYDMVTAAEDVLKDNDVVYTKNGGSDTCSL